MRRSTALEPLITRGGVPQVIVPSARGANQSAQSIHLRRHGDVEPGLQPAGRGAETDLPRPGLSRLLSQASLSGRNLFNGKWHRVEMLEVGSPALRRWRARPSPTSPRERGRDPPRHFPRPRARRRPHNPVHDGTASRGWHPELLIGDPRTMLGLSDGGAHVDMLCDAGYCTYLLGNWVRERQALTLEHAIKRITSEPADFFGIQRRGRLQPGTRRRRHDLRLQHRRLGQTRAHAQRSAGRRTAPGDASRGHRIHDRQRARALRTRPRKRRDAGAGAALGTVLSDRG